MPIRSKKKMWVLISLMNYLGIWVIESSFLELKKNVSWKQFGIGVIYLILATRGKSVINSEHIKSAVGERGNGNQILCASYDDIAPGVQNWPEGA